MAKLNNLVEWFADKSKVMIALSGGVDSAVAVSYTHLRAHETLRSRMPSSA